MKRAALFLLITMQTALAQTTAMDALKQALEAEFRKTTGSFALAFEQLATGDRLLINEREMFHAASTMKTPVMVEVFKQASEGKFRLDDSLLVKNEFKSIVDGSPYSLDLKDDSDDAMYQLIGKRATIRTLLHHMITLSSNLATNILIELVGARNVTATTRALGADNITVLRGVEDGKAFQQGLNNVTNAFDLMLIFKAIAQKTAVDSAACNAMLETLFKQEFNTKIPALLPPTVRVAHKTGNITGVEHDSGIVYLPDGSSYVLVLLSKNLKDNKEGVAVLAKVSRMVFDHVSGER